MTVGVPKVKGRFHTLSWREAQRCRFL